MANRRGGTAVTMKMATGQSNGWPWGTLSDLDEFRMTWEFEVFSNFEGGCLFGYSTNKFLGRIWGGFGGLIFFSAKSGILEVH